MNFKNNSVKNNFLGRTSADITRVLTMALRQKVQNEALADFAILRCEVSPDLGSCRVFVNGGVREFEKLTAFFKSEIADGIKIKRVPNLRFVLDDGEKNTARVEELLRQIKGGGN
jgi:ribosome-binding factor A